MGSEPRPGHTLRRTLTWRGRTVAWDRFGDGPPLVLLHGTPWSSALWRPVADALEHDFTVHLWDMPGFGSSSKRPEDAVDLGTQAELFAHLLAEWGLDRPHVVAHDIGGAVALRARLLHDARYASLCLVDVVALFTVGVGLLHARAAARGRPRAASGRGPPWSGGGLRARCRRSAPARRRPRHARRPLDG